MKLIKYFCIVLVVVLATTTLLACNNDEQSNENVKINFVINGKVVNSQLFDADVFVVPAAQDIDGMVFDGWFFDIENNVRFDVSKIGDFASENVVNVYAKYSEVVEKETKYNINFIVDGDVYESVDIIKSTGLILPDKPARANYIFEGWYLDDTFNEAFDYAEFLTHPVTSDITLYAKMTEKTATIIYNVDGTKVKTQIVKKSIDFTTFTPPTKDNKTFLYWYDNNAKKIFDIKAYKALEELCDVTLDAVYVNDSVKVIRISQNNTMPTITLLRNETLVLDDLEDTAGEVFGGWLLNDMPFDIDAFNKEQFRENITLVAKWTDRLNTITYVANGKIHATQTITKYTPNIDVETPKIEGYFFDGWTYSKDGTETAFDLATYITDTNRADITVNAKLTKAAAKVTFNIDENNIIEQYVGVGHPVILPANPTKNNKIFKYWTLDGGVFNLVEFNTYVEKNTLSKEEYIITPYFKEKQTVIFVYDENGRYPIDKIDYMGEDNLPKLKAPDKQGYTFSHWAYKDNPSKIFNLIEYRDSKDRGNINIIPVYTKNVLLTNIMSYFG